jgi:hypothetical protein
VADEKSDERRLPWRLLESLFRIWIIPVFVVDLVDASTP